MRVYRAGENRPERMLKNEEEIRRIRELIRQNEAEITGGSAAVTGGMQPSFPGKENTPVPEKKKERKKKS